MIAYSLYWEKVIRQLTVPHRARLTIANRGAGITREMEMKNTFNRLQPLSKID
jgi:hypothetical protein